MARTSRGGKRTRKRTTSWMSSLFGGNGGGMGGLGGGGDDLGLRGIRRNFGFKASRGGRRVKR